jgi:hypothetical protein
MPRKDIFGVEVEKGDIVFSAPSHKHSSTPEVGQVSGVFESGRVTIKIPHSKAIFAYEEGAPDVEKQGVQYGPLTDEKGEVIYEEWTDYYGRKQKRARQGRIPYTYMSKDYTVVRREWRWMRKQAADINLVVLRKNGQESKTLEEMLNLSALSERVNLDYDAEIPNLPEKDAS